MTSLVYECGSWDKREGFLSATKQLPQRSLRPTMLLHQLEEMALARLCYLDHQLSVSRVRGIIGQKRTLWWKWRGQENTRASSRHHSMKKASVQRSAQGVVRNSENRLGRTLPHSFTQQIGMALQTFQPLNVIISIFSA